MTQFCPRCSRSTPGEVSACPACDAPAPPAGFPRDPRLGSLVAGEQFRVLRRIGAGGFGVVYEVETIIGGLRRALKVIGHQWAEDAEAQERFINEALVLEQINHPNVARCFAAGKLEDGHLYLLFELIDGLDLTALLDNQGDPAPLEPMRAVRLAKQIAAGLQAAHESGVLHRDLKPDNVLVTGAGTPREQAKIVDFGIAKLTDRGLASTQNVIGTPEFMPPEQFLPGTPLDARVDLWQLGATLHTMLTGRPPYVAARGGVAAIMAAQQRRADLGPAPSEVDERMRELGALDGLVSRLLATDPERRPDSARAVCDELARIEHALSPGAPGTAAEALLGALCATPSASGWMALQGYLSAQGLEVEPLVVATDQMLAGWPDELRLAPNSLWQMARQGAHPLWPLVRSLDLSARGLGDDDLRRLAEDPALATVTRLDLSANELGDAGLEALAASPHLAALVHLDLGANHISSVGLAALSHSVAVHSLRSLVLRDNGIDAAGAEAIASGTLRLFELDLSGNDLGPRGAAALAACEALAGLRKLWVSSARLGEDGARALALSPHLVRLEVLDLCNDDLGPGGVAALASSDTLRRVRALRLGRNDIGRQGLQHLLGSAWPHLDELDLSGNALGAPGAMLLAGAPLVRRLERLLLSDDSLGDAGVAALIGSAHLAGLRELGLAQNAISAAGAALLGEGSPQLEALDLSSNPLGDEGAAGLAEALSRLRVSRLRVADCGMSGAALARILNAGRISSLDLSRNPLTVEGAAALADAAGAASLDELVADHCELGTDGVRALSRSPHLGNLRRLDLASNGLGDAGATALVANAPRLPRLESLRLDDDGLGPSAAEALAASPLATHLSALSLAHNELGDAGAEALARGISWHALRILDLQGNGIGLAGATSLTNSVRLGMVQHLDLSHNALSSMLDVYSLGHEQIALMEESFERVAELGDRFGEQFYESLFARFPGVKPLFARTSMARQHRHLMGALVLVMDNLRTPAALEHTIQELGRRHVAYGTSPRHYYAVTSTLLDTLQECSGDTWSEAHRQAWADGLEAIANVMMAGARAGAPDRAPKERRAVETRPLQPAGAKG